MTSLYAFLVALSTVYIGHSGPVFHRNIRELGGDAHLVRMEAAILATAEAVDMPAHVLAAVVHAESGFDGRVVSSRGARGYMQLLPGTPHHSEWRRICRLAPTECADANLIIGARLLKHNWRVCGAGWSAALARYRGLGCRPRKQEVRVAATARAWMPTHLRLMAWEGGAL